jgi:glycosyltransferase involved in cell wall biosynthesis
VPVVAFDIPPVVELTGGGAGARLVPAGSVPALAAALVEALDPSPAGAERIAAGRALAAAHDPVVVADRLGDLLEDAAVERRVRSS